MRILRGLEEAKNHIASRGNIESDAVPEAVAKGIEDIFGRAMSPAEVVTCILEEVRLRGDAAVKELSRRIDSVDYDDLEVDREEMERAYDSLPEELRDAMRTAAARIASFAKASLPKSWYDETTGLGETVAPLERVGVYVPGGTAAYPSTVLMTVVTARSAGVDEISHVHSRKRRPVQRCPGGGLRGRGGSRVSRRRGAGHCRNGLRHGVGARRPQDMRSG